MAAVDKILRKGNQLAMLYAIDPQNTVRESYLWHEFCDSHLLLPRAA